MERKTLELIDFVKREKMQWDEEDKNLTRLKELELRRIRTHLLLMNLILKEFETELYRV